ncbi:hypothetical protein COD78_31735 [Bacillus cereus]|uniref:hypothetical protein n=1 Tax=Bacillus cereus TaxID=1396 RepID=UPI000BF8D117|nr:hypothetical protein [Bacillus cereus]PEX03440.1 hypothetical protein CN454_31920 [Bacillus cereus]PGV16800.1 hypothetical protein COD78_31735 [Bacillus cereus]
MNDKLTKLSDTLKELRAVASNADWNTMIEKYNMLFLGEKFNRVNTLDLHRYLQNTLELKISEEELLTLIPIACTSLNIKIESIFLFEKPNKLAGYVLQLF